MKSQDYQQVRNWMYRNSRPLDLARWRYHFEDGSADDVMSALSAYQNPDGGFGHALEPDCWNPNSSPIQTWSATEVIHELRDVPADHPAIQGVLRWMDSGADFDGRIWSGSVPTNNDYPHAPWWGYSAESEPAKEPQAVDYNPTAALAGFGLRYARKGSSVWTMCEQIAKAAVDKLLADEPMNDMHTAACYVRLSEYIEMAGVDALFFTEAFKRILTTLVENAVSRDTQTWLGNYVCKPSQLLNSPDSPYYPAIKELARYECDFIEMTLPKDSVWDINWQWNEYPAEWAVSRNWWKGSLAVNNMLYLWNFGRLEL
ncbi:MAG: hypothetical protein ACYC1M_06140 [Armatimonadota bacterium]